MRTQSSNLEGNRCGFIISPDSNTKQKARGLMQCNGYVQQDLYG